MVDHKCRNNKNLQPCPQQIPNNYRSVKSSYLKARLGLLLRPNELQMDRIRILKLSITMRNNSKNQMTDLLL